MSSGLFGADEFLRALTGALCRQSPERALDLGAAPSLVCARCTGIWAGVFAGVLIAGAWARRRGATPVERSRSGAVHGGRPAWASVVPLVLLGAGMAAHALTGSPGGAAGRVVVGGGFGLAVGAALAAWAWPAQPEADGVGRWLARRGMLLVDVVAVLAVLLLDVGRGLVEGLVLAGGLLSLHAAWCVLGRARRRSTHASLAGADDDR